MTPKERAEARAAKVQKMAEMYRQGITLAAIGAQFGVSGEYVRQLIAVAGMTGRDGGKRKQMEIAGGSAMQLRQRQKRAEQERRFGVSYELLQALRACGATRAFQQQKRNADLRGIAWQLTLGQWWAVWQASGKFHLRGKGIGHYCMSRICDDGAYAIGNVHVQLCTENSREAVKKWAGKTKTIRGVFCLYPGRENAWRAQVGKVSLGFFPSAEAAGAARVAYMQEHGIPQGAGRLGRGRGWTLIKRLKARPYLVQVAGTRDTYHATQAEAEAEYRRRCEEVSRQRAADPQAAAKVAA